MSTKKIEGPPPKPCRDPEHFPPKHRSLTPGTHEHTCPTCRHKTVMIIPQVIYEGGDIPKTWFPEKAS